MASCIELKKAYDSPMTIDHPFSDGANTFANGAVCVVVLDMAKPYQKTAICLELLERKPAILYGSRDSGRRFFCRGANMLGFHASRQPADHGTPGDNRDIEMQEIPARGHDLHGVSMTP